jgi:hypothetical protein
MIIFCQRSIKTEQHMGSAALTVHISADPPASSAVFLGCMHGELGVKSRICSYRKSIETDKY